MAQRYTNMVELCMCGHRKDDHKEGEYYCLRYNYGLESKCTCPGFAHMLTLSKKESELYLTDEIAVEDFVPESL